MANQNCHCCLCSLNWVPGGPLRFFLGYTKAYGQIRKGRFRYRWQKFVQTETTPELLEPQGFHGRESELCSCVGVIDCDVHGRGLLRIQSGEPISCGQLKSGPLEGCLKGFTGIVHVAADINVWAEMEPLIRANIKAF